MQSKLKVKMLGAKFFITVLISQCLLLSIVPGAYAADTQPNPSIHTMRPFGIPAEFKADVDLVAKRIDQWYPVLGPRLGAHLTNPNIVLLLADERGLADNNFYAWSNEDVAAIAKFNDFAREAGFRISIGPTYKIGDREAGAWLENLAGYERLSNLTHLPGIPKYKAATGWVGLDKWKAEAVEVVKNGTKEGGAYYRFRGTNPSNLPRADDYFPTARSEDSYSAILHGIAYAYPDSAILPPADTTKWVGTKIPYADYHRASQPNYDYSGDADLKSVNENIYRWGTILGEYYHCPQYQKLAMDPEFQKARIAADTRDNRDKAQAQ